MTVRDSWHDFSGFHGDLSQNHFETEYRSLKENPVRGFFEPCLLNSIRYKRAVGFFRSTVYAVIGTSIIEFARHGGHAQLICSPELKDEDISSIALGYASKSEIFQDNLVEQIDQLLASENTVYCTRILATLIKVGALDIKIAVRADRKGFYHEKIGVFSDNCGHSVSFKGSTNETWSGWHPDGNFESIEVFCSWRGGLESERVCKHERHFDTLWREQDHDIEVFSFPKKASEHLKKAAFDNLDSIEETTTVVKVNTRIPLPHQKNALDAWLSQGGRGIFQHATGSGKTFTAILAVKQHIKQSYPALIIVPSKLLLEQWALEINEHVPEATLLLAGGGHTTWTVPQRLKGMTGQDSSLGSRIVLATMQTASKSQFINSIVDGNHLLLVVDEVHQIGSPQYSQIMSINAGWRLGLSATPIRYGDPKGTEKIFQYFENIVPPEITLADAIKAGRLVPYEYFPHTVNLSAEEAEEWKVYTERIGREIARQSVTETNAINLTDFIKMLLIQRARIVKKATAKVQLACSVLKEQFEEGNSWLVYCEDTDQLNYVISALREKGLEAVEYHSNMSGDRNATMSWFRRFGGICVSVRCLDEGIDIPQITHALILASSQNPRQFIQRRGRVLRDAPNKYIAVIHDAIVVPVNIENESQQTRLLHSELSRALEFADGAINKGASAELRKIAMDMNISPESLQHCGIEDETGEES